MVEIEKGGPTLNKKDRTGFNDDLYELAKTAFADKGEWYSIPLPPDTNTNQWSSPIRGAMAKAVGESSLKNQRAWIRFHKDSDAAE